MKAIAFNSAKSLNVQLHKAELATIDVIKAVGYVHFPKVFSNADKVAIRFGSISAPYTVAVLRGGKILVTLALELARLPHIAFTVIVRALTDVEYHLTDPAKNAASKSFNKAKGEHLAAIGSIKGFTYDEKSRNVYVAKNSDVEKRLKDFIRATSIFQLDSRALDFVSLKQLDKMAMKDDPSLARFRERMEQEKAERQAKKATKVKVAKVEAEPTANKGANAAPVIDVNAPVEDLYEALKANGKLYELIAMYETEVDNQIAALTSDSEKVGVPVLA